MPISINYGKVTEKPAICCEHCGLMACNHITTKKVQEIEDLLTYLKKEHGLERDKIQSARIILKNRNGKKSTYFKRNLKGKDIDYVSCQVLAMLGLENK